MPGRPGVEYEVEVTSWVEWDQPVNQEYFRVPEGQTIRDVVDPKKVEGVWVHAYNPDDPTDEHYFWVYTMIPLTWDQWDDAIDEALSQHGMSMA